MELHLLLPETITYIKECNELMEESMPQSVKDTASSFYQFVKEKLFVNESSEFN